MLKTLVLAVVYAAIGAIQASAADQPVIAPPPAWAKPAPAPKVGATGDGAELGALLNDAQFHFGPDGASAYTEIVVKIQTAPGLSAMGTITIPWNPDLGDLTVHKLHVLREGKVIDVLATQKFTVLRRENNLQVAVIDGVLTAAVAPEDLRVGDVIDLAFTIRQKDPALGDHVQAVLQVPNASVDQVRFRVEDAGRKAFTWRTTDPLPNMTPGPSGTGSEVAVNLMAVQAISVPPDAPPRFGHRRQLEVSDFRSWAEVSALMAPLFAKAAIVPPNSGLNAEIARIKALSTDPKARTQAALNLVQDQIRYLALNMNDGGLVPAAADATWGRRFGDCKGKTALLIALLTQLGVNAQPALVSVSNGDGLNERLPMEAVFDHVIVKATIGDRVYWLDGTRIGDRSLDDIEVPALHWALPVQTAGAELVRLSPAPLTRPRSVQSLKLDASAGLDQPAPAHAEMLFRGDAGLVLSVQLANLGANLNGALRQFWKKTYDFITPSTVSAHFDPETNEERLVMDGSAVMAWNKVDDGSARHYEANDYVLGWKEDFRREPGPYADAPFVVPFPAYEAHEETIVLPNHGKGFTIEGEDIDRKAAGRAFRRKADIIDGVFTMTASTRTLVPEFPAADAPAASKTLKETANIGLYVRSPEGGGLAQMKHWAEAQEDDKLGLSLMSRGDYTGALSAFTQALAVDSDDTKSRALRARAYIANADFEDGLADIAAVLKVDPKRRELRNMRIVILIDRGQIERALADADDAVVVEPDEPGAHTLRAGTLALLGHTTEADAEFAKSIALKPTVETYLTRAHFRLTDDYYDKLADLAAALKLDPKNDEIKMMRAKLEAQSDAGDQAIAEANAVIEKTPENASYRLDRAEIYVLTHKNDLAAADFAWARSDAKTSPGRWNQLCWDEATAGTALELALKDCDTGLELAPDNPHLLDSRAFVLLRLGRLDEAIYGYDAALKIKPGSTESLYGRGVAEMRKGLAAKAESDLAAARVRSSLVAETFASYGLKP